jgi:hypothetical protein
MQDRWLIHQIDVWIIGNICVWICRLGVGAAKVEVRLEKLTVEADVRVGRRAVPTLLNCAINAAQVISSKFFQPLLICYLSSPLNISSTYIVCCICMPSRPFGFFVQA